MEKNDAPKYFVIDNWAKQQDISTTGTRDKGVYINSDLQSYYFKTSINQNKKNYPYEFWSEIIASQLGRLLSLPVLDYHIASCGNKIGCISRNMIDRHKEELVEGVNLIIENEPDFREYCKTNHHFKKIETALESVGVPDYRRIVIEMILFDCIIGNTDRHSENWALIRNKAKDCLADCCYSFAPFYDNGSSLGRELKEERIKSLLESDDAFDRFIRGGKSDIIMEKEKSSFLATIDYILEHYPEERNHFVEKHLSLYNKETLKTLIYKIDSNYPKSGFEESRISNNRKEFVVKLIDARIQYINQRLQDYGRKV